MPVFLIYSDPVCTELHLKEGVYKDILVVWKQGNCIKTSVNISSLFSEDIYKKTVKKIVSCFVSSAMKLVF
jgi:hypothetical protein